MHRTIRQARRLGQGTAKDYLQSMRLWTNFFAVSGAEVKMMQKHKNLEGQDILEVGCGNGRLALKLADLAKSVMGIDIDKRLIDFATDYASASNIDNLTFKEMSITEPDLTTFGEKRFDVIVMPWMLHMVPDRTAALKQAKALLKPGGTLFVFALYGDCDYDRIARHFIPSRDREMQPGTLYEMPLKEVFGQFNLELLPHDNTDFSFVFPDCGVTAEAFTFAFSNWYDTSLKDLDKSRLRRIIQQYSLGNHIELKTRGALYMAANS
ncbi:MAG: class I SAM-dependent methyltransferase [Candidatus Obscuribacter sp.]|nr:class I SAM-dependent methyltransferase [Candidatus Obscuribacter sp.]MBL0184191.1 class I SAM-dependent methyltransferase [Candidatus Obscuribacter sp.]MBP6350333.1 class I SAM-dependent methyltransferase [Candidatus Obscuribacter sp.]MBP6593774.1 class I SAM-dependent methyltransferase [Candidatus Obscuribacter sp.]MBP7577719.1 class I SAM-dependent methyltransferase [Candidatus Obscuribacter sp.]